MKTFRLFFNLKFVWILKTVFCVEEDFVNIEDLIYIKKEQNYCVKETELNLLKNEKWCEFNEKIKQVCYMFNKIKKIEDNTELLEVASKLQKTTYKSFNSLNYNILIISLRESIHYMNKFLPLVKKKNKENKFNLFLEAIKILIEILKDVKMLLPEIEELFNKSKGNYSSSHFILKIIEEVKYLGEKIKEILRVYHDLLTFVKEKDDYCNVKNAILIYEIMDQDGFLTKNFKPLKEYEFIIESGVIRRNVYESISEFKFNFASEKYFLNLITEKVDDFCSCKEKIDNNLESRKKSHK